MKLVMIIDENLTVKNEIDWNEWGAGHSFM